MTVQDFVSQNNGKGLDFDGVYGNQCVDLSQFWAKDNGWPTFTGNAKDMANQTHGFYQWIENTPDGVPAPGDIMVWDTRIGPYGHTSVFVDGNSTGFDSFDQNWNYHPYCEMIHHTYFGVAGWLHAPVATNPAPVGPQGEDMISADDVNNLYEELLGRPGADDPGMNNWVGKSWHDAYYGIKDSAEGQAYAQSVTKALQDEGQLADANAKIAQLNDLVAQLKTQVQQDTAQIQSLKATPTQPVPSSDSITITKDSLWSKIKSFLGLN